MHCNKLKSQVHKHRQGMLAWVFSLRSPPDLHLPCTLLNSLLEEFWVAVLAPRSVHVVRFTVLVSRHLGVKALVSRCLVSGFYSFGFRFVVFVSHNARVPPPCSIILYTSAF